MSLPEVNMTVQDGALGTLPPNVAGASVKIGVCSKGTPNVLTAGFSDTDALEAALGRGPLVEAIAQVLDVAGGPVYACPVTPSVAGSAGSVTHVGTGAGTVTPSLAPDRQILAKISTGGALQTMQVQFSVDGGAYGAPVLSGANPWTYSVPGTLVKMTFATGTYILNDIYTASTAGTVVRTGTGPSGTVSQASSPVDAYDVLVTIATAGGVGVGAFTYSLDGGNNTSPIIAIPGSGVYVIPGTGVVLTFASTFVANDTYSFTTVAAGFSSSDVNTAMDAITGQATEWGFVHVVGAASTSAGAITVAAALDVKMTAAETAFRFAFGIVECPTSESDSTVIAAKTNAGFTSKRVMVCAGDAGVTSAITGLVNRRNSAWVVAARLALIPMQEDPAWVGRGPLSGVRSLYRDEAKTQALDEQGFTTLRTHIGLSGYYITNGRMMAPGGSDFTYVAYRRVMDRACQVVRAAELPFLNQDVRVDTKTGYIDERDAQTFEAEVNAKLRAGVVSPGGASSATVVMSRTVNLLAGENQPVTIRLIPKAYLKGIDTSIGFSNPALG